VAQKDGFSRKEVASYIKSYLKELESNKIPPKKFVKKMFWITEKIDRLLGKDEKY
jgi:hypothetical protein